MLSGGSIPAVGGGWGRGGGVGEGVGEEWRKEWERSGGVGEQRRSKIHQQASHT